MYQSACRIFQGILQRGCLEAVPELQDNTALPGDMSVGSETRREVQNDLFGGNPVVTGQTENPDSAGEWQFKSDVNSSALISAFGEQDESSISSVSSVAFAATGLEPVNDIWHIPALPEAPDS